VIFGNPESFAIEAIVEPGPDFGPVQGRNVVGRLRAWIGSAEVGRIQVPACWLGPPCDHLVELCERLQTLWDPSLDGLTPDEQFDRLDHLCFGAHRGRALSDCWSDEEVAEVRRYMRFLFLLHSSEAFDGWKAFLVRPTSDTLQALVAKDPQHSVQATVFTVAAYTDAVRAFASWLAEQERLLLPSASG